MQLPTTKTVPETAAPYIPGLEGIIAAQTRLSRVDGQRGELIIAGYPVEELAGRACFEQVVYLLWHDRLPSDQELTDFQHALAAYRTLPQATVNLLAEIAAEKQPVMAALRMAAGTIDLGVPPESEQLTLALVARMPANVATYWRLLNGLPVVPALQDGAIGHAANYLYMMTGEMPGEALVRGLETYLNTVVDHGLNASTFTARVIIATDSDMVSAIVGAIGALKGPKHGGAPGPALDMVLEIGAVARAEAVLREKLGRGERLMGFGHRVYKVRDPRAEILSAAAEKMFQAAGDMSLYELAKGVEETAVSLLAEYKPGRDLQTNVEFFTALLLHGLGLDSALFAPTFAVSRTAGWIAHCLEHMENGRLIRPKAQYVGETGRRWGA